MLNKIVKSVAVMLLAMFVASCGESKKNIEDPKERIVAFANELTAYMESDEFIDEVIDALDGKDATQMASFMETKMTEMAKDYGYENMEDFQAAVQKFKDDEAIQEIQSKIMNMGMKLMQNEKIQEAMQQMMKEKMDNQ